MVFSLGYLGLFCLLASTLAHSSYTRRSSDPSPPGNRPISFSSPIVSSVLTASNSDAVLKDVPSNSPRRLPIGPVLLVPPINEPQNSNFFTSCFALKPHELRVKHDFKENDCWILIQRIRSEPDAKTVHKYDIDTPLISRTEGSCNISLELRTPETFPAESFALNHVFSVAGDIIDDCRHFGPPHFGGFRDVRRGSHFQVVVEGVVSQSDKDVSSGLLTRARPAKPVSSNVTTSNHGSTPPIQCLARAPNRPRDAVPYEQGHCDRLIARIFSSPGALALRAWLPEDEFLRTMRTCGIRMGPKPGVGFPETFALGDIAYIASLIVVECSTYGPPYLGGSRGVTGWGSFEVTVFGIGPLPEYSVSLEFPSGNPSLVAAVPSTLSKRTSPAKATPSSTSILDPFFGAECYTTDSAIFRRLRPFEEPDCNILIQRVLADPTARDPKKCTPARTVRYWTHGTCKLSFGTKEGAGFFPDEYYSPSEIMHVVRAIIDECRHLGPPHYGGRKDAREGSAFSVVVWGIPLASNPTGENTPGLPVTS